MSTDRFCEVFVVKKLTIGEHGVKERTVGKFSVEDDGLCRHLCDYDGTLMSSIRNESPSGDKEYLDALADLANSGSYSVSKKNLLAAPAADDAVSAPAAPASVFSYLRQGMQQPHIVELHAGKAVLDGSPLEHDEVQQILANVRHGLAELRYHGASAHNEEMGNRIKKAEGDLLSSFGTESLLSSLDNLRKMVNEGILPKSQYDVIRRELYCDEMIPEIGNKRAYRDFTSLPQEGVYVMIDLNSLKEINDKLGHEAGDQAIVGTGQAMRRAIDGSVGDAKAKAWRFGGDEFCFYVAASQDAAVVIRALRQELEKIPPIGGLFPISVSTGVGASPGEADAALYRAKAMSKLDLGLDKRPAANMYVSHHQPAPSAEPQKKPTQDSAPHTHKQKGTPASENRVPGTQDEKEGSEGKQKLNMQMAQEIRAAHQGGMTMKDLAYKYNVTDRLISDVVHNRIWTNAQKSEQEEQNLEKQDGVKPPAPPSVESPDPAPPAAPKASPPALVAVHNLSEQGLQHAHKMGGLPAPSIAVAHKNVHFGNFGEVSLVAHHDMVDPAHTPVFDADVFTPRYPPVVHHLDIEKLQDFQHQLREHEFEIGRRGTTDQHLTSRNIVRGIQRGGAVHHLLSSLYLKEKGLAPQPQSKGGVVLTADHEDEVEKVMKQNQLQTDFSKWKKERLAGIVKGESIVRRTPMPDGSTKQEHVPHTLENATQEMTRMIRGGEDPTGEILGLAGLRALYARQFKSKDEMKEARSSLRPFDRVEEHNEGLEQQLEGLAEQGKEHFKTRDSFDTQQAILKVLRNTADPKRGLGQELVAAGFGKTTPVEFVRGLNKLAQGLRSGPTGYFEAKPQRAVRLSEFKGAVVPHDVHPDTMDILRQHGIVHVEKYQRDNPEDRWAAVRRLAQPQKLALSEGEW